MSTVVDVSVGGDHFRGEAVDKRASYPDAINAANNTARPRAQPPQAQPPAGHAHRAPPPRPAADAGDAAAVPPGDGGRPAWPGLDQASFRDYVIARGPALLRAACLLTGNRADAEDLVQAALAKTYLAWDRIEDRGALDGYVRRAMINTHISWWRRRKVEEYPTDEIPDQAVADHAGRSDQAEALRRAIDRLPQQMRAAVLLRFYEDMTEAEIADKLGVSLGTVKSTVSRAVAKLRVDAELLAD